MHTNCQIPLPTNDDHSNSFEDVQPLNYYT